MKRGHRAAMVVPATVPVALAVACAALLALPGVALGFADFVGSRGLAMGQAGRADARGDQGPLWNPAGMSLARLYTVDGEYGFITRGGGHAARLSVVDSTSAFKLAGGLFYGYRTASPAGLPKLTGHEAGIALSYPFADRVLIGVTAKYLNLSGGVEPDGKPDHSGFTADAGITVRAGSMVTIGFAGYNLRELSTVQAPRSLGYGVAVQPTPDLTLVADGYHDFTTTDPLRGTTTTVSGGAEYVLQRRIVFRVGGGRDGGREHGFLTGGLAALSELGSLDFGVRQDVSGDAKLTFIAAGVRLFVPQP
jgi:hypothetical protein